MKYYRLLEKGELRQEGDMDIAGDDLRPVIIHIPVDRILVLRPVTCDVWHDYTKVKPTKVIPLTRGQFAIVDEDDYEKLSQHKWRAHKGVKDKTFYACRREVGSTKDIFMHQEVLSIPQGMEPDHINGNGLDNTKANLRLASRSQNMANTDKHRDALHSRFKGVYKIGKKFRAAIMFEGKKYHCGYFDSETDAALAYNESAKLFFGQFARLNEVSPPERPRPKSATVQIACRFLTVEEDGSASFVTTGGCGDVTTKIPKEQIDAFIAARQEVMK